MSLVADRPIVPLLHELGIERLAFNSEKIYYTLLVIEHHVDDTRLRMPVCADGGNGGGVDIFHQQLQISF